MSEKVTYWNNKLEKIQYALDIVEKISKGANIVSMLERLESEESKIVQCLVDAELADEE